MKLVHGVLKADLRELLSGKLTGENSNAYYGGDRRTKVARHENGAARASLRSFLQRKPTDGHGKAYPQVKANASIFLFGGN